MYHFVFLTFFLLNTASSDPYAEEMSNIAGFEESITTAKEDIEKHKEKLKKAKTLAEKKMIKSDIKKLENSIDSFEKAIKKIGRHIILEHPPKEKKLFKTRHIRNKRVNKPKD